MTSFAPNLTCARGDRLSCSEIWGGIEDTDAEICAAGLRAALHSRSCRGGRGGDVHYLSVCDHDMLARCVIADVTGHGPGVSAVGRWLYETLAAHLNDHDDSAILSDVNRLAVEHGLDAIATAVVVSCCRRVPEMTVVSAGHPPALVRRRGASRWTFVEPADAPGLSNLPLGVHDATRYQATRVRLGAGDRLVLYTDGLVEARGTDGREFGTAALRWALDGLDGASLGEIKSGVLDAVTRHTGGRAPHDDVTLLAIEVT